MIWAKTLFDRGNRVRAGSAKRDSMTALQTGKAEQSECFSIVGGDLGLAGHAIVGDSSEIAESTFALEND